MEDRCHLINLEQRILLHISPLQSHQQNPMEDKDGQESRHTSSPDLRYTALVGSSNISSQGSHHNPEETPKSKAPTTTHGARGRIQDTEHDIPFLRNYLEQFGLDKITKEGLMLHAWRKGTVNKLS